MMIEIRRVLQSRNALAVLYFLLFYIGFGAYLFIAQERLIYYPPNFTFDSCPALPEATLVEVNSTRLFVHEVSNQVLVIYPGNAGTVCDREVYARLAAASGWSYILVSYSGYGDGTAHPTHARIRLDVENVVSYLQEQNFRDVRILGESIGSGVASYHASLLPPNAIMLITPFDTLENVARHHYWFYPTRLLVREAYNLVENLKGFQGQVTIIHGTNDSIIPVERAQALYYSLETTDKKFIEVEGADHNNLWRYIDSAEVLKQFLK